MISPILNKSLPEPGESRRIIFASSPALPVWIFRPSKEKNTKKVIIAVHGISRNSIQQIKIYSLLAEEHGLWLLAPEFSEENFSGYQRLAKDPLSPRSDLVLNRLLLAYRTERNITDLKAHICGYSGGAQFAHRYALLHPYNVASLTLVSAGWYTFPNHQQRFPRGLNNWPLWLGTARLKEFLNIPIIVMVGNKDRARDSSLRTSVRLDQDQGVNRLQRADTWVKAANHAKKQLHLPADITLHRMPKQRHDFEKNASDSEMLARISKFWTTNKNRKTYENK
ncbi:MAG: pimeloyl-ACP methyl ester carboxylesterase [Motiliproteus sp.]|jgi:pimeloyl-ACP methyl ester carboxylesterase